MKFEDLQTGMFVEVTDKYRAVMPESITWGGGFGQVIEFEKICGDDHTEIQTPKIKWANGFSSTIHPTHLQPSTKKAFFIAALQG